MKGFGKDMESLAVKNDGCRRVLYTARHCHVGHHAVEADAR